MLHRVALGETLKTERLRQGKTLRQVADGAPIALGYLSEVERGQKELSSELLEGVLRSLGMTYADLLWSLVAISLTENERQVELASV